MNRTERRNNFEPILFLFLYLYMSSNINEVIRPVLNFLYFFYDKFHNYKKALKSTKMHQKAPKSI